MQPREKLLAYGAGSLSDLELLSVILGSGTSGCSVSELSKRVLSVVDRVNGSLSPKDLLELHGIGSAKATSICAAVEFARRRIRPEGTRIRQPGDVYPLIRHFSERKQEHFLCVSLNGANEVISTRVVTIGLVNSTQVHPREVFADPIQERAAAIIVAHNHPSGQLDPSKQDLQVTEELKSAAKILGIRLLDHLIISRSGYFSFQEKGLL